VTLGIPPSYPATGYGYIHFNEKHKRSVCGETFFRVLEFKEKPTVRLARSFLKGGNHFWNSGMFLWRANVFARKLHRYAPTFYPYWERILEGLRARDEKAVATTFGSMPSISIDYALMETAQGVLVCEGNFGWSDVGAWSSLAEIWTRDDKGNAVKGDYIALEAQNCLIYNPQRLTAVVGVKDLIIVNAEDGLLVCPKGQDQRVREIIEHLKKTDRKNYL
jgi:mannose-1-phosphate guanylyltransferase